MMSGREQLRDWMHRRRFLQQEVADHLGIHFTAISQILTGKRTPGLDVAVRIERGTGIPVEAWLESGVGNSVAEAPVAAGTSPQDKA